MADLHTPFPSDFLSDEEKKGKDYGKQVGQAIDNQWFGGKTSQLSVRRWWIERMRAYSKGEQTTDYKKMIEGDKKKGEGKDQLETKTHKIDYSEKLRVLPVFKDILTNAIDESLFKPKAEATDITAVNRKKEFIKKLEEQYYTQDIAKIVSQGIGTDITPQNMPKDDKELEVRILEFKPKIEIAQELAIESVMKQEDFEKIKDKIDEDLFDCGLGVGRTYTDYTEGIKLKYVDIYDYIHSSFEMDNGKDIRYHGVVEVDTIGSLIKEAGVDKDGNSNMSADDLQAIYKKAMGSSEQNPKFDMEEDSNRLVEYIVFAYPVTLSRVYKKRKKAGGTMKLIDRTDGGFDPKNPNKKIEIPYTVWFQGIYVPQAQVLVKWEEIPNQIVDNVGNPICPFIVYAPKVKRKSERGYVRFDSMVQRSIAFVDDLHRDWYKFQQLKMELRPNTVEIDVDAINRVALNGEKIKPQYILDLFFGRGVLLKNGSDSEGDPMPQAIMEQNGGINNSAITLLSQEFANNYNRIRQVLGINELRDGTTQPNSKTAVTVQKLLLASSNNATNHLVKASFNISLDFAKSVSHRLYDVFTTKALKDRYMDMIGNENVDLLDEIKKYPMTKFAIYFDFKPDNEERLAFEQSLVNAFSQGQINVAQYNNARHIKNTKSANKYLEYAIEENRMKTEEDKLRNIEKQAEANARTSILTEQTKQQTITIGWETKKQEMLLADELDARKMKRKALIDDTLKERDHTRKMQLEGLRGRNKQEIETEKEDRKDNRVNLQDTNQSQLIEQRKNNGKPKDFQNELDDILNSDSLLSEG